MIALYPTRCNICSGPVKLVSNDRVYSPEYAREHPDKVYLCLRCGAYVGVHWHTHRAKGILADKHMRKARMFCHDLFDSFWHGKRHAQKKRQKAYAELARRMDIPVEECHFGWMDVPKMRIAYHHLLAMQKEGW